MKHSRTAPRALTGRRSRLWDSHATSSLTQDSEASKNLSVIFNSQGNRWICRSTNLLEKQLWSGTLPGTGAGRLQPQPWRGKAVRGAEIWGGQSPGLVGDSIPRDGCTGAVLSACCWPSRALPVLAAG